MLKKIINAIQNKSVDKSKPNVLIILLDQFRYDALSAHPVFEKLRKESVFLSNYFTYAPYTLASCHAFFTGMYGRQNGVDAYTKSNNFDEKNCYTMAQYFKDEGYYTSAYTFSPILFPRQGFQSWKVVYEQDEKDILASHIKELEESYRQSKPFFTFLHYGEIHHDVVREVIKKYSIDDSRYFGKIEENAKRYQTYARNAGDYLEKLLAYISNSPCNENTILMVTTDHGGSNGEKVGEKAYGTFTYDYTIKIWNYLKFPDKKYAGESVETQLRNIDILPSFLDLLSVDIKKNKKKPEGKSILPVLKKSDLMHRLSFSETGGVDGLYPSPNSPNIHCVRDGKWKLIFNSSINKFELYDLNNDPNELNNLYPSRFNEYERLWPEMLKYLD